MIPLAFDMGINFFFVSTDLHWPAYEAVRKGLRSLLARGGTTRDDVVVAGTTYLTQPGFLTAPFQELIDEIPGLDRLDFLIAGGSDGDDLWPRLATLRAFAKRTRSPCVGASFHRRSAAVEAIIRREIDICYIRYNPTHPGARTDVFPKLGATRSLLFGFKSMFGFRSADRLSALGLPPDFWRPGPTDYYRYALSRHPMKGLLFSVSRARELTELNDALPRGGLAPEEEAHLEHLALLGDRAYVSIPPDVATGRDD